MGQDLLLRRMPQNLVIRTAALPLAPAALVVLYAGEGMAPRGASADAWALTGLDFERVAAAAGFSGKPGQLMLFHSPAGLEARRLLVLGAGKMDPGTPAGATAWSDRGGSLMAKLPGDIDSVAVLLDGHEAMPQAIAELAAGIRLRHYKFDKYKARRKDDDRTPATLTITLHVNEPALADAAIGRRMAVAEGTLLARDLVNEPANVLGTEEFVARIGHLAGLGVEIEVLGEPEMRALGMNALLAVAQGSVRPPRLVVMRWDGGPADKAPVAIVGKGVVFDSGGISIKPGRRHGRHEGRHGGCCRRHRPHVCAGHPQGEGQCRRRHRASSRTCRAGTAMRPGDILTAMSGTTIEVVNTDAEGRLVLADALWFAQQRFKPSAIIDLATLTGAIGVALGSDHAGLFSNDDALSAQLLAAGLATGEKLWRLPMGSAYDKIIESRFADIKNSGGRPAGSITAAQFLGRFINATPWAHLDIAGVALGPPHSETNTSWAPGFGVALLDRFLRDGHEEQ